MFYEVAGASIESDIALPRLARAQSEPRSGGSIRISEVSELPVRPADCVFDATFSWSSSTVWVASPEWPCECAISRAGISYTRAPHATDCQVQSLLLYALPAAFAGAGWCVVHGGAVSLHDGAWLVLGQSGAGKSTTTAALAASGAPIIADDILIARFDEAGDLRVYGLEPRIALTAESRDVLVAMGFSLPAVEQSRGDGKGLHRFAHDAKSDGSPVRRITVLDAPPYGRPVVDSLERFTLMMKSMECTGLSRHFHGATLMRVCGELVKTPEWRSEWSRDLVSHLARDGLQGAIGSKSGFGASREGITLV